MKRFDTYAEVSPSGRGLKIWALLRKADREAILSEIEQAGGEEEGTKWARRGGEHPPAIELFLGRRYFTYTGQRLDGAPDELRVVPQETLLWLLHEAGPAFKGDDGPEAGCRPRDESRSAAAFPRDGRIPPRQDLRGIEPGRQRQADVPRNFSSRAWAVATMPMSY